jgi:hypothetical protein
MASACAALSLASVGASLVSVEHATSATAKIHVIVITEIVFDMVLAPNGLESLTG